MASARQREWARREAQRRIASPSYDTGGLTEAVLISTLLTASDNPYSGDGGSSPTYDSPPPPPSYDPPSYDSSPSYSDSGSYGGDSGGGSFGGE